MPRLVWLELTFIALILTGAKCLKNVRLEVSPQAVEQGQEATLRCFYELEEAPLYSLKYYRGSYEFYRYSPSDNPSTKIFNFSWIDVDPELSNESQVTIRNVDFQLAGNVSCEVTTDAPTFSTASSTKTLSVVSIPKGKPVLASERNRYEPGETLRANCSMPLSRPPAQMYFTLNDDLVSEAYVSPVSREKKLQRGQKHSMSRSAGMSDQVQQLHRYPAETSQAIELSIPLQTFHYRSGQLNLRCVVKIAGVYEQWSELQLGASPWEPVPERVRSASVCNQSHRITDLTILGLLLLLLSSR